MRILCRTFVSHQLLHIALFLGSWTKKETNSWLWLKFVGQACRTQILHREFVSNWMWNPNHVNLLYFPHCLDFAIAALCTLPADKKTLILITFIAVVFPCGTLFNTIPYRSISTIPLMYHCLIWWAYMHTGPLPKLQVKETPGDIFRHGALDWFWHFYNILYCCISGQKRVNTSFRTTFFWNYHCWLTCPIPVCVC